MIDYLQLQPNWRVNYSTYVDNLQVFKSDIYSKRSKDLINKKFKDYTVVCDKTTLEPILIEMKEASKYIGELDDMSQNDIIETIERYINGEEQR